MNKKSKFNLSDGEEDDFEIEDNANFLGRDDYEDEDPFNEDDARRSFGSESKYLFFLSRVVSNGGILSSLHAFFLSSIEEKFIGLDFLHILFPF